MAYECPKCGFLQPKDRYCASCGIDIENYKPAAPPWYLRFLTNSTVQMVALFAVTIGCLAYIYVSQENEVRMRWEQVENLATGNFNAPSTPTTPPAPEPPLPEAAQELAASSGIDQNDDDLETSDTESGENSSDDETETLASAASDAPAAGDEGTNPSAAAPTTSAKTAVAPKRIEARFAKVPVEALNLLLQDSPWLYEGTYIKAAAHKGKDNLDSTEIQTLGSARKDLRPQRAVSYQWIHREGQEDFGFSLQLVPNQIEAQQVQVTLNGFVRLKSVQGLFPTVSTPPISFSPQDTLIIVGFVPRLQISPELSQEVSRHFATSPLSILTAGDFAQGYSEFAIFFQPRD